MTKVSKQKKFLITGSAGFIGFSLAKIILDKGHLVFGIDNLNSYYDVSLKKKRLSILKKYKNFYFEKVDICEEKKMSKLFSKCKPEIVIHLAAQAGVRYSISNPEAYIKSNILGFFNVIDISRKNNIEHFVYASTSSVYGENSNSNFREDHNTDHPIQLYAATKKSNEVIAHSFSSIYKLPCTGLRFFTVYGPWGRPDMALFKFTKNILEGKPIDIFNNGNHSRSFTYIDDLIDSIYKISLKPAKKDKNWDTKKLKSSSSRHPYRILNIGSDTSIDLMFLISLIEKNLKKEAIKNFLPLQPGDIKDTKTNTLKLKKIIKHTSRTSIENGVKSFIDWYRDFYR
tara:strand:+ start:242 stop:1267 length:1026 start_codon:yes stop_codon:yes gene_type:complete